MYIHGEGYCCDVCHKRIYVSDLHKGEAIFDEEGRHVCKICVEDYKKNSDSPDDLCFESINRFAAEQGTWEEREEKERKRVLDALLDEYDKKRKLE